MNHTCMSDFIFTMDLIEGIYSFSPPFQVLSLALIFLTYKEREKRREEK